MPLPTIPILFHICILFCSIYLHFFVLKACHWLVRAIPPRRHLSTHVLVTCTCLWQHAKPFRVQACVGVPSLDCSCQSILITFIQYLSTKYTVNDPISCSANEPTYKWRVCCVFVCLFVVLFVGFFVVFFWGWGLPFEQQINVSPATPHIQ